MSDDNPEEFAFGSNEVDGAQCPVRTAGRNVAGYELQVASKYDSKVQAKIEDDGCGTVPKEVAEDAWQAVIDEYDQRAKDAEHSHDQLYHETMKATAEEIKEEVF